MCVCVRANGARCLARSLSERGEKMSWQANKQLALKRRRVKETNNGGGGKEAARANPFYIYLD